MKRWIVLFLLSTVSVHCDGKPSAGDGGPDAATDSDADSDVDTDADTDSDSDPGSCLGDPVPCDNFGWYFCEDQLGCNLVTDCLGDPVPCSAISGALECFHMLGCEWDGNCEGTATPCNNIYSGVQCNAQIGCMWDSWAETCSGLATSCWVLGPSDCGSQQGCYLTGGNCAGTSFPCDGLDATQCGLQVGCETFDQCLGEPVPCESITDQYACVQQAGCYWGIEDEDAGAPDGGDTDDGGSDDGGPDDGGADGG